MSTDKPKGPVIPFCCIKKSDGRSYCGREVKESHEQLFHDAGHAVRHYKDSKFLRACADCVKVCENDGVGGTVYVEPMATRGLDRNDR